MESYWRSIILFGRNVASYKFALSKSLLEIIPTGKSRVTLQDLALPYSLHICEHLKNSPKQATSPTSQFLQVCADYNEGSIDSEKLAAVTEQKGFNNVIEAFHVVNNEPVPVKFFEKDYSAKKKIIITDDAFKLLGTPQYRNFEGETEARWNLVESAWAMGISCNLLEVYYDDENKLFQLNNGQRRKSVTSARNALNGYQKGKCFFCFDDISISGNGESLCEVDHFFPHTLFQYNSKRNWNGVWNLVLACPRCNRGADGKFSKVPSIKYLNRLHRRNEYLISSHHPLRETLISQTGATEQARANYLNEVDLDAISILIHRWETPLVGEEIF